MGESKEKQVIWKDISGYEGMYKVSDTGLIRSVERWTEFNRDDKQVKRLTKGRILKQSDHNRGYKTVSLHGKRYLAHRLVAITFIGNPENKPCVDHIDEDKTNNDVSNLRWVTHSENTLHSMENGSHVNNREAKDRQAKTIIISKDNIIRKYNSIAECSRYLKCNPSAISYVLSGHNKSIKGYSVKYAGNDNE